MEKKVIDLEIIDDLAESGTQKISLVDSPAIEKDWMYFKKVEEFVNPKSGESESDYMGRCVPALIGEGKDNDQAVAICISTYENMAEVKMAKVSFDFDDTLSTAAGLELAMKYKESGDTLYIISARNEVSSGMLDRAKELDIPESRVYATGSNKAKVEKVNELGIDKHVDNNADVIAELAGKGEKFEINTGGLPAYTQQADKKKKDLVTEPVNMQAILDKAKTLGFSAEDFTTNGLEFHKEYEGIDVKLAKGYTVYKYEGPISGDSRDFCRQMVGLDRFYTFQEINQLSSSDPNPGFGLEGASNYSIWKYLGGPNCHHFWQKFYVTEAGSIENKGKAPGTPGTPMIDRSNNGYAFAEVEDKKELVGAVAIPDMEIYRKDKQGNPYYVKFSKDVIRRMAEKFMREQKLSDTNIGHEDVNADSYVYESWVVEHDGDKANTVYGLDVPIGTWCIKMRVVNQSVWEQVKAGKLRGFSLEGDFVSKEEYDTYMKDKKMYQDLISLVNGI